LDLTHERILIEEILAKKWIQGPSRCTMFLENAETIPHLFWECSYTATIWKKALMGLENKFYKPTTWKYIFGKWVFTYKGPL